MKGVIQNRGFVSKIKEGVWGQLSRRRGRVSRFQSLDSVLENEGVNKAKSKMVDGKAKKYFEKQ